MKHKLQQQKSNIPRISSCDTRWRLSVLFVEGHLIPPGGPKVFPHLLQC